jgi:hypothetical protein
MLRAILTGLSVVALGLGTVQSGAAETVRDTDHNFRVSVPAGWESTKNPSDEIRIVMGSPNRKQTGGNCNVVTAAHPQSKTMSPAQIETELDQLNDAAWASMFKAIIFFDNVVVEKSGSEQMNGRKAYYAVVTLDAVSPGAPLRAIKLKQYWHVIPGEMFIVTCSATQDGYAQEEDSFKTVFDSFAPLNDAVAAAAPKGVPSLTLYARANFGGVSRVVTQDTPDLAAFGWHDAAASMSVGGAGLWQVCTGANYSGSCRVVATALHEKLAVGSARRVSPAQSNFALMLQAGGAQSAGATVRGR